MTPLRPLKQPPNGSSGQRVGNGLVVGVVCVVLILVVAIAWWLRPTGAGVVLSARPIHADVALPAQSPVTEAKPEPVRKPALGPDEMELCGLGVVSADGDPGLMLFNHERTVAARNRLAQSLVNSPNEQARAAGWLMQTQEVFWQTKVWDDARDARDRACPERAQSLATAAPESAACSGAQRELNRLFEQESARTVVPLQRLADIAAQTRDPAIYANALSACQWAKDTHKVPASCEQLNAARWAQLDPQNYVPWLVMAGEARRRGDPNTQADAFYRVGQSSVGDSYLWMAAKWVTPPPGDPDPDMIWVAAHSVSESFRSMNFWVDSRLPSYCSAPSVQDANRRQLCERIAQLMVETDRTELGRMIGIAIGERLGWPAARTQAIRNERLAQAGLASIDPLEDSQGPIGHTCAAYQRRIEFTRRVFAVGEKAAFRERMAASGHTIAQGVALYRQLEAKWKAKDATAGKDPNANAPAAPR